MSKRMPVTLSVIFLLLQIAIYPQSKQHDKAVFQNYKNEFYENVKKEAAEFNTKDTPKKQTLKMDFSNLDLPTSIDLYTKYWHSPPINQGITGTCWCFSTTSFYESEIYRLTKRQIKLSEMYTVYWEYVEKAKRFVRERGESEFGEGSEANAVSRIWKLYGVVPQEAYTGMQPGQKHHDHSRMFDEMNNYLKTVEATNAWNENEVIATIKSILNHYLGVPPTEVSINGKSMTPTEYLKDIVKLNLDDYVEIISLMEGPYYKQIEYKVPDNWWHSDTYYNVPLDEFMKTFKSAIRKGYTIALGGDVSEPGYDWKADVGMIPTFDLPSEYIDENARQFRFSNGTTTDDHGIHCVGYMEKDGKDWYLIKDSGSGAHNSKSKGYYFYQEDYVKLKIIDFMVHKDAVGDLLKKF